MKLLRFSVCALLSTRHLSMASMMQQKKATRNAVKEALERLPASAISAQSGDIASALFAFDKFAGCKAVCIYLSMASEVATYPIVERCLREKKRVFIPKVTGKGPADMVLHELASFDEIERFPRGKWNIPEPDLSPAELSLPEKYFGALDLIVVPGVAFDRRCSRVGHGKGYYDCFISRVQKLCRAEGRAPPLKVALSLQEQMFDEVPSEGHDEKMDYIITSTSIVASEG